MGSLSNAESGHTQIVKSFSNAESGNTQIVKSFSNAESGHAQTAESLSMLTVGTDKLHGNSLAMKGKGVPFFFSVQSHN